MVSLIRKRHPKSGTLSNSITNKNSHIPYQIISGTVNRKKKMNSQSGSSTKANILLKEVHKCSHNQRVLI
jgi:hypothetical protein